MKHRLHLIILSVTLALTATAQQVGDAFYIYRNDGQFNAFFRDEVQSIEYSYEDINGNRYDEIVTQIVTTADSVYKIPLSAIDSVGFVQPEIVVNKDVFPLTAEHSPYISNADIEQFTMSAGTPAGLLPKVGNIVAATADCDAFPDGIVARVLSVGSTSSGWDYRCEHVGFDEVFDQIVYYGEVGEQPAAQARQQNPRKAGGSLTKILWDETWSKTITYSGTTTTLSAGDRASMKVTFRKQSLADPLYMQVQLQNNFTSQINFNAKSTASIAPDPVQMGNTLTLGKITIPIPYTFGLIWLAPKVSLFGYFEEKGTVELNYSGHLAREDKMTFTYLDGSWHYGHQPRNDAGTDIASLSMQGSAEVGIIPKVYFSLCGTKAGFGADLRVGLKESINFLFDATKLKDGGLYAANKDSYCRTTIPYSVKLYANANLFGRYDASNNDEGIAVISKTFEKEPQWGNDKYLLPMFSGLHEVKSQSAKSQPFLAPAKNHTVSVSVSRDVLLPTEIGMVLTDEDGNTISSQSAGYTATSFANQDFAFSFSDLQPGKTYYVRPSVGMIGATIPADQKVELKEEGEFSCPDENHPHLIDLGLPSGTQWACCNVGASFPEQYGNYYAWGETSPKGDYTWENYAYYNSSTNDCINIGSDIGGTSYDAATMNWGAPWRMPSLEQCKELISNCTSEWTTQNGVNGRKFTGPNGGTIFLPAAGDRWGGELYGAGSWGEYWSSSLNESGPYIAYHLGFGSGGADWDDYRVRGVGRSVRPVR